MVRPRFVLRYRGDGAAPEADVSRVHDLDDASVVASSARMLLVESDPEPLRALLKTLPDWIMAPEQQYGVPDTRLHIERPAG